MPADPFTERLARVRQRFVTTLESKIKDTYAELPKLSGNGPEAAATLDRTYRRMHGIVGIGLAVGFAATGKAAKTVEDMLRDPHRAARGLAADEIDALTTALNGLRETASRELQTILTNWR
jgi:chemotaxis protein histidine kinase CheA